ncbi:MAG: SCO family protein [Planctomycetes bacterium]|nr:SCO family protein [Planctomycetota bacterium]
MDSSSPPLQSPPPGSTQPAAPTAVRPGSFAPIALGIALIVLLVIVVQRLRQSAVDQDDAAGDRFGSKLAVWGPVPDLALTDRFTKPFTRANLADRVFVVNFFFTGCPGPCVDLTRCVRTLAGNLRGVEDVSFASITVDPDADTHDQLTSFARANAGEQPNWHWLTGTREEITKTCLGFFAPFGEKDKAGDIVHSTKLYVVDRQGQIRSRINTQEDPDWLERAVHDIRLLLGSEAAATAPRAG